MLLNGKEGYCVGNTLSASFSSETCSLRTIIWAKYIIEQKGKSSTNPRRRDSPSLRKIELTLITESQTQLQDCLSGIPSKGIPCTCTSKTYWLKSPMETMIQNNKIHPKLKECSTIVTEARPTKKFKIAKLQSLTHHFNKKEQTNKQKKNRMFHQDSTTLKM